MADINTKMNVTGLAQFKQSMQQAAQSVKTYDAQLRLNEKQLQATGDKEQYMANKAQLLQKQIAAQTTVVKQGQAALQAMEKNGVNPASTAYQRMQQQVANAQASLLDMQGSLQNVGQAASDTAGKTDQLTTSLNSINKKVNFDAVLGGIGKITSGMEAAARKVAGLASDVWNTMAMAGAWADNENTLATMYGLDVETLQRMQYAAESAETTIDTIMQAQQKLKLAKHSGKEFDEAVQALGVQTWEWVEGRFGGNVGDRPIEDIFWDIGTALRQYGDEIDRDVMSQKLFGRSWRELIPLFDTGREKFNQYMDEAPTVDKEDVDRLNELDEALRQLRAEYEATEHTLLSEIAPAFTAVGTTVKDLLHQFNEYLKTDEGQQKLSDLSEAVTSLFSGLSDVDFGSAVDTAGDILTKITDALEWIEEHHTEVEGAIRGIGTAFLVLKGAEIIGGLVQGAAALKTLLGGGGAAAGASAAGAAAAGAAGGTLVTGLGTGAFIGPLMAGGTVAAVPAIWDMLKDPSKYGGASGKGGPGDDPWLLFTGGELGAIMRGEHLDLGKTSVERTKSGRLITGTAAEEDMQGHALDAGQQVASVVVDDALQAAVRLFEENLTPADLLTRLAADYDADFNKGEDIPMMDALYNALSDGTTEAFDRLMEDVLDGTQLDPASVVTLLETIKTELLAASEANPPVVKATPQFPADVGSILQNQLAGVALHVPVIPNAFTDGSHANGLPFVPFDGYIAALHKGERVVPAAQNKSYTNNSNLYVDRMIMQNNTDVQGLAAAIAERSRRAMAGFGG